MSILIKVSLLSKNSFENFYQKNIAFSAFQRHAQTAKSKKVIFLRKDPVFDQLFQYIMQDLDERNRKHLNTHFL